jgi:hypothetical protein
MASLAESNANSSEIFSALALLISALALAISFLTAWLTLLRHGTVKMTRPTVIFFGPDGRDKSLPKVFLRTLLFSSSKRGRIIESMYVRLSCEGIRQDFAIWTYGARNEIVRGSGLFVPESGVEANHHFLMHETASPFAFISGRYRMDVYCQLLGDRSQRLLFSQALDVSAQNAEAIGENDIGLYFDWAPEKMQYVTHIDRRADPRS